MAYQEKQPIIIQKLTANTQLINAKVFQDQPLFNPNFHNHSQCISRRILDECYVNGALQFLSMKSYRGIGDTSMISSIAPVFANAPAEKGFTGFAVDFLMGGVSAAVSKSVAAPIERVKLLIQNQDEMIKNGRLSKPYNGITDCFARTIKDEGFISLWRGNTANVIRYFPTQVRIALFRDP